jgi:O86/O127-antigen biosynthesis beta-1,3-galactosyltransferase
MIDVIMPCSGDSKHLKESISSILNQTYEDFTFHIVVNCTDNKTLKIINSYDDCRIKVHKTSICQLSFSVNYILNIVSSEYIARMDSDDIALPNKFEKQINYLNKHGDIDVLGTQIYEHNGKSFTPILRFPLKNSDIRKKIWFKTVFSHPTVLIRRSAVIGIGGYMAGKSQDLDLWLRLSRNNDINFANLDMPLLVWRNNRKKTQDRSVKLVESYSCAASYLYREFLIYKSVKYLIGAIIYSFKVFFRK